VRSSGALAALLLLCAACAGEKAAVKTTSSPRPPSWMAKVPVSSEELFFTGASDGAASLEEGKASAVESARSQAAQFIGVEISAEHRDVMSTEEAENMARDTVNSRASAMLRSAEIADVYSEKISREVGSGTVVSRFDVWVLIRLPRAEVEKERQRQAQEAKDAAAAALGRFREGGEEERRGNLLPALVRYRDALARAKALPSGTPTGDGEISRAGALSQRAQDAAVALQGKVRRTIVVAPDWAAAAVTQALARQGFTAQMQGDGPEAAALARARAQGTPWVIVVRATTAPGGKVFSQVAATAALDVRALDAQSGAVVASAWKQAKAVGRTAEAAQQAAASEAGLGAGSDLAAALVAKENAGL
jgi:hypothetical protein